ncbi:MAG: hypothetical protein V1858_04725 [Candidatus Gottesmanbacteria bacterium]
MNNQDFQSVGQVLKKFDSDKDKYISREFQAYGFYLAEQLNDLSHKALYIKYAKEMPRGFLDEALSFVKNAGKVKSRARLFMWKLKELRKSIK